MEFGVLGPLLVRDGHTDLAPTAPKQRQMLALLLVNAGRVVSVSQLVNELWGLEPPPRAVAAVHTYVMQLRRTLHDVPAATRQPGGRLITKGPGYLLDVHDGELDLHRFDAAVRDAGQAMADHDDVLVAERLRAGLDLWRGAVLVDVPTGPVLSTKIAAIERRRLDAIEQRIQAELNLGQHHELLGEIRALVQEHPTREDFVEQLMLALYRSGRRVDALAAFRDLQQYLRHRRTRTPSRRMHVLYRDMLSGHPRLEHRLGPARLGLSLDLLAARAE